MKKRRNALSALAVTAGFAGAYYLLNQKSGRRNRAEVRNRLRHLRRLSRTGLARGLQDGMHRTAGIVAELRGRLSEPTVTDRVLQERVRATLGHYTTHSGAIRTEAKLGTVVLSGPVMCNEQSGILRAVRHVRGVRRVENKLQAIEDASHVSSLQGAGRLPAHPPFLRTYWPPFYRLAFGALGTLMFAAGARRRRRFGDWALTLAGIGLTTRAVFNRSLASLLGVSGRPAISVRRSIHIESPVAKVYELWRNPENFPGFMRFVRDVAKLPDGGYLWQVSGPAETTVSWIGDITHVEPNRRIEWKSRPGSTVRNEGQVTFEQQKDGSTVAHVTLDYTPPAGVIGHLFASMFGADPRSEMIGDLARMKTLLETGAPAADAARPQVPAGMKK